MLALNRDRAQKPSHVMMVLDVIRLEIHVQMDRHALLMDLPQALEVAKVV